MHARSALVEVLRSHAFRIGIYGVMTLMLFQLMFTLLQTQGAAALGAENGPLELTQMLLAVAAAILLFVAASKTHIGTAGITACAALVAYAAAREADTLLETALFDDAYKYVVGLPALVVVFVVAWKHRRDLLGDSLWLMNQPAATMFAFAGIYLCCVCQFLDRPAMWSSFGAENQTAVIKAMVEEYSELFAYVMMFFSSIEAILVARQSRPGVVTKTLPEEQTATLPRQAA